MTEVKISSKVLKLNYVKCTHLAKNDTVWRVFVPGDEIPKCVGEKEIKAMISISGSDYNGNGIQNFEKKEVENIGRRKNDGKWENIKGGIRGDRMHSFKINKISSEVACVLDHFPVDQDELKCGINAAWGFIPKPSGGYPFNSFAADPMENMHSRSSSADKMSENMVGGYILSWMEKIVKKAEHFYLSVEDQFCTYFFDWDIDIPTPWCSLDPNDITGPVGFGKEKWISSNERLEYKIRFENDAELATRAASKVVIKHPIDSLANIYSYELGSFGFGNYTFNVPANSSYYSNRIDVIDSLGVYVDVVAGLDIVNNEVYWVLQSINPATGLPPYDSDLGFLLVNDSITHRGEGFVEFSIKPKHNVVTGDSIFAKAEIIFDTNDPIATNKEFNTIDADKPDSKIYNHLVDTINGIIELSLDGYDPNNGSGIQYYEIYVSINDEPYQLIERNDTISKFRYQGEFGNNYRFYSIAIDNAGNKEVENIDGDISVSLLPKDFSISYKWEYIL